jgi:hypothetical protein
MGQVQDRYRGGRGVEFYSSVGSGKPRQMPVHAVVQRADMNLSGAYTKSLCFFFELVIADFIKRIFKVCMRFVKYVQFQWK